MFYTVLYYKFICTKVQEELLQLFLRECLHAMILVKFFVLVVCISLATELI